MRGSKTAGPIEGRGVSVCISRVPSIWIAIARSDSLALPFLAANAQYIGYFHMPE
jgi:hypothetical protein